MDARDEDATHIDEAAMTMTRNNVDMLSFDTHRNVLARYETQDCSRSLNALSWAKVII